LDEERSFVKKEDGFYVNPLLLRCVHHPNFERRIKRLM
jgi:hypothetical protein